jgi:hypothetical protein
MRESRFFTRPPNESASEELEMKTLAKIASFVALAVTMVPCALYFFGTIEHEAVKWISLVGTAMWFVVTPFWMGREIPVDAAEVEI